jgi:hypothetical protein
MLVDLFGSPERLWRVWLEMSVPGKGFTLGPAALADVRDLLAPIAGLQLLSDDIAGFTHVLSVSEQLK